MSSLAVKPVLLVIEMDFHADILGYLLASIDKNTFEVHCITTPAIRKRISADCFESVRVHEAKNNISILEALKSIHPALTIFNTCASRFRFWVKHCPENAILRIHNINATFIPLKSVHIGFNFYEIRKAFTYIVWLEMMNLNMVFMKQFLKKISWYSFMSEKNEAYFKKTCPDQTGKIGPIIPMAAYESKFVKKTKGDSLKIVIAGSLEKKRKNFAYISKFTTILADSGHNIELHFAGSIPKSSIPFLHNLIKQETSCFKIITYNRYLPQEEFDSILQNADLLFMPMTSSTRYKIYRETYSKSKISGGINDLIKTGKYSLIPNWYQIDENLKPLVFTFDETTSGMKKAFYDAIMHYTTNTEEYSNILKQHSANYSFSNLSSKLNISLKNRVGYHG